MVADFLQSMATIPEPHEFTTNVRVDMQDRSVAFEEHEHAGNRRTGTTICGQSSCTS
jgi:hypothetical protein